METVARVQRRAAKAGYESIRCLTAMSVSRESKLATKIEHIKSSGFYHNKMDTHRIYVLVKDGIIYNFNPNVDEDYYGPKEDLGPALKQFYQNEGFQFLKGDNVVNVFETFIQAPHNLVGAQSGLCAVFAKNVKEFVSKLLREKRSISVIIKLVQTNYRSLF